MNPSQHPTPEVSSRGNPRLGWLAILVILLIAGSLALGWIPRLKQRAELRMENHELSIQTVEVIAAMQGSNATELVLSGEMKPMTESPIFARASGYLTRRLADLGSSVTAGQVLAEIDTPELNQELARARAELRQAEAGVELSNITAARWAALLKSSSVSEQEAAEKNADQAVKQAQADALRANVGRLEELQRFSRITAPFAGQITSRRVEVGDLIQSNGGRELFRLADLKKLRVFVHVPQTSARMVHPGLHAILTLPELPGKRFPATVVRSAGVMEMETRTLLAELEVDNAGGELLAGGYAQVHFEGVTSIVPLTLPATSLLLRAEGPQVGVVDSNGVVELRKVVVGRDFGPTIEILEHLGPQERVVMNPTDSLVHGTRVRVLDSPRSPVSH